MPDGMTPPSDGERAKRGYVRVLSTMLEQFAAMPADLFIDCYPSVQVVGVTDDDAQVLFIVGVAPAAKDADADAE
jgi:hypothetical protein